MSQQIGNKINVKIISNTLRMHLLTHLRHVMLYQFIDML
jgi:hypothetical protein